MRSYMESCIHVHLTVIITTNQKYPLGFVLILQAQSCTPTKTIRIPILFAYTKKEGATNSFFRCYSFKGGEIRLLKQAKKKKKSNTRYGENPLTWHG